MKVVYRVEDSSTGIGMFRNTLTMNDMYGNTSIGSRHRYFNTPSEDGIDVRKDDKIWYCAYKNLETLIDRVTINDLRFLVRLGHANFRAYKIEVREYQEGDHQIIFTKESILEKRDITNEILEQNGNQEGNKP